MPYYTAAVQRRRWHCAYSRKQRRVRHRKSLATLQPNLACRRGCYPHVSPVTLTFLCETICRSQFHSFRLTLSLCTCVRMNAPVQLPKLVDLREPHFLRPSRVCHVGCSLGIHQWWPMCEKKRSSCGMGRLCRMGKCVRLPDAYLLKITLRQKKRE